MKKSKENNYQNAYLGMSKTELKKVYDSLWIKLLVEETKVGELEKIRRELSKCEESFYAEDCGDFWRVRTIPDEGERSKVYNVKKEK